MIKLSELRVEFRRFLKGWRSEIQLCVVALLFLPVASALASDFKLGLPIDCRVGEDCFFQNFSDIDPGPDIKDPWCGRAAYDSHSGTDIRLLSMEDIQRNVPVIASADGVVKGVRDGVEDILVVDDADRQRVKGKECGNGVLVDHGNSYSTQYCHLKNGSVNVAKGQSVKKGDVLGYVGNSGMSQFPHVHVTLRKNRKWVDIITGNAPSDNACTAGNFSSSYLEASALLLVPENSRQLMASGLSGMVFEHGSLVVSGAPETAKRGDPVSVAWGWFINLQEGDVISITARGPNGFEAISKLEPLDRQKATYSAFSGKRQSPQAGTYEVTVTVTNDGETVLAETRSVEVN